MSNDEVELLTIPEFCKLARISRGTFYNLAPKPPVIKMGGRRFVAQKSANEWLRSLEVVD